MPLDEFAITLVTLLVMVIGLVGVIIPGIPDMPLIWLAAICYGLLTSWDGWLGGGIMALLTVLTIAGVVVDFTLGPAAAKRGGASWQAILVSSAFGLVGFFMFPPFGAILGALLGMFLVEYRRRGQNAREAARAVKDYAIGFGLSVVVRLVIGIVMVAAWGVWVWLG